MLLGRFIIFFFHSIDFLRGYQAPDFLEALNDVVIVFCDFLCARMSRLALSNVRKEHHRVTEVVEVMAKSIFHTHKENWARGKKDAVDKLDQEISQMLHMRNSKKRSRKRGKMNSLIQSTPTHAPTLSPTTDCNKPIVLWDTPMAGVCFLFMNLKLVDAHMSSDVSEEFLNSSILVSCFL